MAREYSEDTQKYVDDEIARIVAERYDFVLSKLRGEHDLLSRVAERLLETETIDQPEFVRLIGGEAGATNAAAEPTGPAAEGPGPEA